MTILSGETQKLVVREHFREASTEWDSRYGRQPQKLSDLDLALRREHVQTLMRQLLADSKRTRLRVLDLGCGTGNVLEGLPRERLQVIGMDLVPEMAAAAARVHPQDCFAAADAGALPLADSSVDMVTCLGLLEYVPDPLQVLTGIQRVVRPAGHIILSIPNRGSLLRKFSNIEVRAEQVFFRTMNVLRGRRAGHDGMPRYRHAQWTVAQIGDLIVQAGLNVEAVRFHTYGLWGRLGCARWNLSLCRRMTRRFCRPSAIARNLAFTVVILLKRN